MYLVLQNFLPLSPKICVSCMGMEEALKVICALICRRKRRSLDEELGVKNCELEVRS